MKETVTEFEHFRLHKLYNKKFKKCSIEIHLRRDIDVDVLRKTCMLTSLMFKGTEKYPSQKEINRQGELLYGLRTSGGTSQSGKTMDTVLCMDFLNPKYVDEDNYLEDSIDFLFDFLRIPLLSEKDFDLVKDERKLYIKKRNENLSLYSNMQAAKTIDALYAIEPFETEEDVDNIKLQDLRPTLKSLIEDTTVDIYVFGNLDMQEVEDILVKKSIFKNNKISKLDFYDHVHHRDVVEKDETANFEQSMIVYYYSFEDLSRDDKLYNAATLDEILGGGLKSLLYKDIREKHSLCYSLSAYYIKYNNLLKIAVGVNKDNIEKTKERIEYIMSNLDTLINESNVNDAKLNIINGILSNTDSLDYLIYESDSRFNDLMDPLDVKLKKFENVKLKDIKALIPKMKIYTKYVVVGDKHENN